MSHQAMTEARQRVLLAAEQLFAERGYQAVSLRDIAQEIGIRHTSLYHHVPQGKEALFVEVTELRLRDYHQGLVATLKDTALDWQGQLRAAALWLLSQKNLHFMRMLQADLREISDEAAEHLRSVMRVSLLLPLEGIFKVALQHDPIRNKRTATYAGMFLALIEGVSSLPASYISDSREELVEQVLDLVIYGVATRPEVNH